MEPSNRLRPLRGTYKRRGEYVHTRRSSLGVKDLQVRATRRMLTTSEEEDEDEDEDLFTSRRSARRRSQRRPQQLGQRSTRSRVLANCGPQKSDGIRRSTRQKKLKFQNVNDSWIFGAQSLKGYPSRCNAVTEEDEEEEEEEEGRDDEEEEEEEEAEQEEDQREQEEEEDSSTQESKDKDDKEPIENGVTPSKNEQSPAASSTKMTLRRTLRCRNSSTDHQQQQNHVQSSSSSSSSSEDEVPTRRRMPRTTSGGAQRSIVNKYHLRKTKPTVDRFQIAVPAKERLRLRDFTRSYRRRRSHRRSTSSSSSDSSSSSSGGKRKNRKKGKRMELACGDTKSSSNKLADAGPMTLDKSILFSNIGGLQEHVDSLKEMILFPILYPDLFCKFGISPPKGVLFHGPPGTGKTLMARALANECSRFNKKVSFFMRKGADVLSKWVGESERQLRILFQEAYQGRPSIIFFDELDGLAPVRSSKQDQIHASIVCTLLALMDGLDSRGEIIIIGATNRIDSIDPALRRPGRFDRELHFPLPGVKERREILSIHAPWADASVLNKMAETSAGYCGSDLKALCTEAVIQALKRVYPQIYSSNQKLLLDNNRVQIESIDFERASRSIVPASKRGHCCLARKLPTHLEPLLGPSLAVLLDLLGDMCPQFIGGPKTTSPGTVSRLLIHGDETVTSILAFGLLYKFESTPVHSVALESLFSDSSKSPEEGLIQIFQELPHSKGAVLWFGDLSIWFRTANDTLKSLLFSLLLSLDPCLPLLFLATSPPCPDSSPESFQSLFKDCRNEIYNLPEPSKEQREAFFRPLFRMKALKPPPPPKKEKEELEVLPIAPPTPPPPPSVDEIEELHNQEETILRELRIFLRQICAKLARNKQFYMFSKPVDVHEVPDYLQVIKEPMDLETMMTKIDLHSYNCARDFLNDVDLVVSNALEYNPDRDPSDKLIRHRACYLRDTAYALIKAEMDSDFEINCRSIRDKRKSRSDPNEGKTEGDGAGEGAATGGDGKGGSRNEPGNASNSGKSLTDKSSKGNADDSIKRRKRRRLDWSKGVIKKVPRRSNDGIRDSKSFNGTLDTQDAMNSTLNTTVSTDKSKRSTMPNGDISDNFDDAMSVSEEKAGIELINVGGEEDNQPKSIQINRTVLNSLLNETVEASINFTYERLLDLHSTLSTAIDSYSKFWDRRSLPEKISKILEIHKTRR